MTSTVDRRSQVESEQDWLICDRCQMLLYRRRFQRLSKVCPECGWHCRLTVDERLDQLLDQGSMRQVELTAVAHDPLRFTDRLPYAERLRAAQDATGMSDAVRVVRATIQGHPLVVAVMDFRFLGGSLGSAAGEAVTVAAETALQHRLPLLLITASGGARMQEGVLSLMQMAKTSNAMAALDEAGLLTITLVTDPTYGGVAASFATLSDVVLAEPGARMGFAGPRVIEQTIRERLPDGFQSAEFLLRHGLVDEVRSRTELPSLLGRLLTSMHGAPADWGADTADPALRDPEQISGQPVAETIRLSRNPDRPTTLDHLANWSESFVELHGDRTGADCPAIVGGLAELDGLTVMVIGHQKAHNTEELVRRNFAMPTPAGYRKAIRLMRLAAKLAVPVVTLVDTPGAYPGLDAERGGQSNAISDCLRTLGGLRVPVVCVITGEGGSGGALALAVADRVLLCANATYSVISPEGCAAILWRNPEETITAAEALRVDGRSLLPLGVIDAVVPEPPGGAHLQPAMAGEFIRDALVCALRELRTRDGERLVQTRRERFRRFGREGR